MVRTRIMSDLHLNPLSKTGDFRYEALGEDVCILAGDISEGMSGVYWALDNIPEHIRVFYVPGNHEYYGQEFFSLNAKFDKHNKLGTHVKVLNNESEVWGGVNFVGTTLWTDFRYFGQPHLDKMIWASGLNDSRFIEYGDHSLQAEDVVAEYRKSLNFLRKQDGGVLITHYCPQYSVAPHYMLDRLTAGFASRIPEDVWCRFNTHIHGHTHEFFRYKLAENTPEVVCNPKGYDGESDSFLKDLIIDLRGQYDD